MLRQANGLCATLTDFKRTSSAECICVLLFCFFYSFHHSSKFTLKKKLYINNIYVNFSALLSRLLSLSCIVVLCFDFFFLISYICSSPMYKCNVFTFSFILFRHSFACVDKCFRLIYTFLLCTFDSFFSYSAYKRFKEFFFREIAEKK